MTDQFDPLANFNPETAPEPNILDQVFAQEVQDAMPEPDAGTAFIRVTATNGYVDVPVSLEHEVNGIPGYTVAEVLQLGTLYVQAGTEIWVNGASVGMDYVVTGGQSITVIGPTKGG